MAKWGVAMSKDATSVKTVGLITAAAANPRRAKIYDISFGCSASPADNAFLWQLQRCSSAGTGTGVTPNALDPADTLACTIVCKGIVTADPTLTASAFLYQVALNQRASFRWVAAQGSELVVPATTSNGVAIIVSSATTTVLDCGAEFEEQ